MGLQAGRWLARPRTLDFLRHVSASECRPSSGQPPRRKILASASRRAYWTSPVSVKGSQEKDNDLSANAPKHGAKVNDDRLSPAPAVIDRSRPSLTRTYMSMLVGEVHGVKEKTISDTFCARMFATIAFPIEMVIKGLAFLGVEELGILATRELAVRSGSHEEYLDNLKVLNTNGITVIDATYTRLLHDFSVTGQGDLFDALLASDQHPESYDEFTLQETLLKTYLAEGNFEKVHLTLMAFSLADPWMNVQPWNVLLQHYAETVNVQRTKKVLETMRDLRMHLTLRSLDFLHKYLLTVRRRGHHPEPQMRGEGTYFERLDCVTNAYIYATQHGQSVSPALWTELLKRYGMSNRMDRLESLILWLLDHHIPPDERLGESRGKRSDVPRTVGRGILNEIFLRQMRGAIIVWEWRGASTRGMLLPEAESKSMVFGEGSYWRDLHSEARCAPWARGLQVMKWLRKAGLKSPASDVRDVIKTRLRILFGPGQSSKAINNEARRRNFVSLTEYIRHANEVWGSKLFDVDDALLEDTLQSRRELANTLFGERKVASRKARSVIGLLD